MSEPSHQSPVNPRQDAAELRATLQSLTQEDANEGWHAGARIRNYFLTGLLIVGPVTLTLYIFWWLVNVADAWIKPFVPRVYLPESYLPFQIPGMGLIFGFLGLTMIGALAANLLGRTLISFGELMLGRMPIVRNVYRALKQIFESVVSATEPNRGLQKVGLIEFPSKGLWSLVFVTGETGGEIASIKPAGEDDLLNVWVPTGIVPPTGFVCFIARRDVIFLKMKVEDAAKVIVSGGMVMPDAQARLKRLAAKARGEREATRQLLEAAGKASEASTAPPDASADKATKEPPRYPTKAQRRARVRP